MPSAGAATCIVLASTLKDTGIDMWTFGPTSTFGEPSESICTATICIPVLAPNTARAVVTTRINARKADATFRKIRSADETEPFPIAFIVSVLHRRNENELSLYDN